MSFRVKLFFIFLVYGLLLALATELVIVKINFEFLKKESSKTALLYVNELQKNFESHINDSKVKLKVIRESKIFAKNFKDKGINEFSKALFLDIAKTSPDIMQLRYIDKDGNELICVQRDDFKQDAYILDEKYLQNKAQRYYFKEILQLNDGEYWLSNLDLNVDEGKITQEPVIRIGTPYYYHGEKQGILIINIFMQDFLNSITSNDTYNVYLVDSDNYMLVNSSHKNEWNRYLGEKNPKDVKEFLNLKNTNDVYSFSFKIINHQKLKIILIPKEQHITVLTRENFYELLWVILIALALSLPLSYVMSILPAKLKAKVDILNKQLENEAKEKDVLLSLFDLSDAVLFKWNNDENWSVSFVSKSVENLLGYPQEDFITNKIVYANCIHHDDLQQVQKEVEGAINSNVYFFEHQPYRVVTKDKKIKWILDSTVIVRNTHNEIVNFVGYLTDITDLKEKEFELKNLARVDQLTKINNRLFLDEMLMSQYYRFNRYAEKCSVILADIDHFKSINDQYGHLVGDKILVEFAALMQNSIRKDDYVGRWGGEEFLIILPHTNIKQATFLAEKLCNIVAKYQFSTVGHLTASFGVATIVHGMNIEQCIDKADDALYAAKEAGRNMVKVAKQS